MRHDSPELLARASARDAHIKHFSSRRGVWYFEDADLLVLYNNNPHEHRDEELAALRDILVGHGIKELAFATYPRKGKDAGYTYAMVVDASRDREELVAELAQQAAIQALKLYDQGPEPPG